MTQQAAIELLRGVATEHSVAECSPRRQSQDCSLAHSERIGRSEARGHLSASLWLTSLQKPGVFEVVPTENVSRFGVQMVAQKFWDPAELVLISSPPELCVEGSVVYCKKLPGDDYILGIRLGAPVEHWTRTRFREIKTSYGWAECVRPLSHGDTFTCFADTPME